MTSLGKMQLLALAALPQLVFHDLLQSKANRHWTTPTLRQVMRCLVKWNNQRQTLQSDPVWPKTMHFGKDTKNTAIRFLVACEAVTPFWDSFALLSTSLCYFACLLSFSSFWCFLITSWNKVIWILTFITKSVFFALNGGWMTWEKIKKRGSKSCMQLIMTGHYCSIKILTLI